MNAPRSKPEITVAAGVLSDSSGRVLIAQRPDGKHQAGWWEFPGGKLNVSETPLDGLTRELREELGVAVRNAEPLIEYSHEYPERIVNLQVWLVHAFDGDPVGLEGQALRWSPIEALMESGLLPADRPIVDLLLGLES